MEHSGRQWKDGHGPWCGIFWNVIRDGVIGETNQRVISLGDKRPLGNVEEKRLPNYVLKSVSKEKNKNGECKRRIRRQGQ